MQCSNKCCLLLLLGVLTSLSAQADFDEATKAYLQGDFEKARYEALVDATDGKPAAQMLLGQLYFNGEGVEKDLKAAMYWYEKAAAQGFTDAQYRLGSLYFDGNYNIPKDYDNAYKWLQLAMESGHAEAKSKVEGLFKLETGKVVNLHESPEVLQQVASSGNQHARFLYSEKLLKGEGFPQDKAQAVAMLTEDAKQGFVKAQKRLGELYFYGDGVAQDYYEAYAWSMAYAGTKDLGGLMRDGKQTARSALRKLDDGSHQLAYEKSREYFEQYVLPFHKNAREVGPDKYRIVVTSQKPLPLTQQQEQTKAVASLNQSAATTAAGVSKKTSCDGIEDKTAERTKEDVGRVLDQYKGIIDAAYNLALRKNQNIKGRIEIEIEIDPSGSVSGIKKRPAGSLNDPEFETQLVERIKQIDFCAKGVKLFTVAYPIEFIPPADNQAADIDPVLARTMEAVERKQGAAGDKTKVIDDLRGKINAAPPVPAQPASPAALSAAVANKAAVDPAERSESTSTKVETPAASTDTSDPGTESDKAAIVPGAEIAGTEVSGALSGDDKQTVAVIDAGATDGAEKRNYRDVHNVFIRHKSKMNDMYLRAYEQDKKLRGRIIFELTIEPDGTARSVEIQSSELEAPGLEEELIDYVKSMDFGKKNTTPYELSYPIDFLP
ncbi:MAG: AgmX/PglI C-terminal domain-containing protein [Gammaproteobacteria bacterium]|nr:AgmX/PglI C-terminal domain-containing protein [Gammaproteobacteria bacterium]